VQSNIKVTLFSYDEDDTSWEVSRMISTDSSGRFSFSGLYPSAYQQYRLKFENENTHFVEFYKDASSIETGADVNVALGKITLLNIYLGASDDQPESLDGVVKDTNNKPLNGVLVRAYQSNNGDWSGIGVDDFVAETYTDSNGHYSFDGLVAGTYRIRFDYTAVASASKMLAAKGKGTLSRLGGSGVEYYQDATSLVDATDIVVSADEVVNISDVIIGAPDIPEVEVTAVATDGTASEAGNDTGIITVSRTGGNMDEALTVKFNVGGTATPGQDYKDIGNSVTIPAGASSATIEIVPIMDNDTSEADETVIVSLIDPVAGRAQKKSTKARQLAAKVGGTQAIVTIINNAAPQAIPTLQQWALVLLIMLLLLSGLRYSKKGYNRW